MNFNANAGGARQPSLARKIKRVSDVNSMGYNPYEQQTPQQNLYENVNTEIANAGNINLAYMNQQQAYGIQGFDSNPSGPTAAVGGPNYPNNQHVPYNPNSAFQGPQLGVFGQPVVQDMAMQYGQQLAGAGKTIIKQEVERYIPVTRLKYYFAVDTKYVLSKLMLLFFPFTHSDWSVKYEQEEPVQPRFEINAPDLYLPTMGYITYVLVAGLVLGMQQRFTPEHIGILASSALAWCLVELAVYSLTLYLIHVETSLRTLDLLAYSGYKFVGTIVSILISTLAGNTGYYCCLAYSNLALAFFLVRTLKAQVMVERNAQTSYYGETHSSGNKRRLYFLLFVAAAQPLLSWWLSFHLLSPSNTSTSVSSSGL